jgi:hypothetical protein
MDVHHMLPLYIAVYAIRVNRAFGHKCGSCDPSLPSFRNGVLTIELSTMPMQSIFGTLADFGRSRRVAFHEYCESGILKGMGC